MYVSLCLYTLIFFSNSLISLSHFSTDWIQEKGSWKSLVCSQVRSCILRNCIQFLIGIWSGRPPCGTELFNLWGLCYSVTIRMELNCRTPSWCCRELLHAWRTQCQKRYKCGSNVRVKEKHTGRVCFSYTVRIRILTSLFEYYNTFSEKRKNALNL